MHKRTLRITALLLAVCMLAAVTGGCAAQTQQPAAAQTTDAPAATSPGTQAAEATAAPQSQDGQQAASGNSWENQPQTTISLFYDKSISTSDFDKWWGKDLVSSYIIENTNVDIKWMMSPDNDHTKLQILVASGELPDVLVAESSLALIHDLVLNDMIWAINELEQTAAPDFISRNIPDHSVKHFRIAFDSMNLYCLPTGWYSEQAISDPDLIKNSAGVAVIEQVYEELGSPDTSTLEGFLDMLRQVKQRYPDMIPAQASRNSGADSDGNVRLIYKLFQLFDLSSRYDITQDGTYIKYIHSEKFLDLLKFVNTLYNENLIDRAELTDTSETMQAKLFNGMVFCNINQDADNIDWFSDELQKVKPDWNWIMIEAPSAYQDQGIGYTNDGIGGGAGDGMVHFITKGGNAARALQLYDFIFQDETQLYLVRGTEDAWESYDGSIAVLKPEVSEAEDAVKKGEYGVGAYWLWRGSDVTARHKPVDASEYQQASMEQNAKYYQDYSFFSGAENYASDSEEVKIFSVVKEYYQTAVVEIIMCDPNQVESKYETMIQTMMDLGQGKLDEYINNYYQNKAAIEEKYSQGLDLSYMD